MKRSQSIRTTFDWIWGGLLLFVVGSGSLALVLAKQQRFDAVLIHSVSQQQALVHELTQGALAALSDAPQAEGVLPGSLEALKGTVDQVDRNLIVLQTGGRLQLGSDRWVEVPRVEDAMLQQSLGAVIMWWRPFKELTSQALGRQMRPADPRELQAMHQALQQQGKELLVLLEGLAANFERWAVAKIVRLTQIQFVFMLSAIGLFLLGLAILRGHLITPLQRMAQGIEAMRRTGRLVKVPAARSDELGVVGGEFNRLAEQVEQQKHRLRDHLEELQRINVELESLAQVKDAFLSTVSQHLRTPLMAIVKDVGLLRGETLGPLTNEQREHLQAMTEHADRLMGLLNDLLDLGKLQSGQRRLTRQPDDLIPLLQEGLRVWQPSAGSRSIRLELDDLSQVFMDRAAIHEVVDHLVRNAMRSLPEHGQVTVSARRKNGMAEVSVKDTGPGIAPERLDRLFLPFQSLQQPEAPGSVGAGSGLGLAICKQIVERHRGWIRVDSTVGQGSTFTFAIPLATPQFLFQDACLGAQAEAEREERQFGLILLDCAPAHGSPSELETLIRTNVHRGDRLVWMDQRRLAIVAVADQAGIRAMHERLRGLLRDQHLEVAMGMAIFPEDGLEPMKLLERAASTT